MRACSRKAEQTMADANNRSEHEVAYLPPSAPPTNHGHTSAAWATTILVFIGVAIAAFAVLKAFVPIFWVGMGVVAIGLIVGKVMALLGYGQPDINASQNGRV